MSGGPQFWQDYRARSTPQHLTLTSRCLPQVRNLTYMVTRREKMKRSLWRVQEQIFQHQIRLIDQELLTGESPGACVLIF